MNKVLAFLCLVVALVSGCGARQESFGRAETPPSGGASPASVSAEEAPPPAPPPPSAAADAPAQPAPAPASVSVESTSRSAQRDVTRDEQLHHTPGLGTEWGEQRESRVHDVTFVRADRDRPFAIASMQYNDRDGVNALVAYHEAVRSHETSTAGGALTVSVVDASGEPLEAVHVGDRTYVVGAEGQRYSIVLTNHTGRRVEAVATVDGLDVINGQPGTMQNRGYVVMPFATLTIDGFRQSQDSVAAFRFSRVSESYAAQVGKPRNVGVIGVAFFAERGDEEQWTRAELERRDTANPFPGSDARFARPPR